MVHELGPPGTVRKADNADVETAQAECELHSQERLPPWMRTNSACFHSTINIGEKKM